MYGAIIGDISGSIYEYGSFKCEYPEDILLINNYCEYTDDSVLTCAIADAILNCYTYKHSLLKWSRKNPDIGYGGNFVYWFTSKNPKPYNGITNGCAMRVSPCGWLFNSINEVLREAKKSAEVTHNHPNAIKGAQAVAAVIFWSRKKKSKLFIKRWIENKFNYCLDESIDSYRTWYKTDLTCEGTVLPCIRAFIESKNFINAIQLIVSIGGDADTMGCITGSMAEAFYGTKSIPKIYIKYANGVITSEMFLVIKKFYNKLKIKIPYKNKMRWTD